MLAEAGARVVHNPISNLKLKSGIAPILDLHRAGIEIALGCDNYSCAETQNIFLAMKMLCLLPAVTSPEPHPVDTAYALRAATLHGANAAGFAGKIGALKAGMAADFAILDLNQPAFVPIARRGRSCMRNPAAPSRAYSSRGGWWCGTTGFSPSTRRSSRQRSPRLRRVSAAPPRRWPKRMRTWSRPCSTPTA
jgi:cytosine/adenosine deaminase-related metal-dependent hydrolase